MASPDFNQLLKTNWKNLYESGDKVFRNTLKAVHTKPIGKYTAHFNLAMIENKRETQIDFDEEEIKQDFIEKFTEQIKITSGNVYKNFDESKFNFNKVNPKEILFTINLDEESIITNEKVKKDEEDIDFDENQLENEISESSLHPVLINISPIAANHCILPLFPTEELPQVIGSDILVLLLQVFKMSNSETLRVGYNSIGGYSSVNHLHFQLIYADDLIKSDKFPMELAEKKEFHRSGLQSIKDEINMYSVGVIFEELSEYPARTFVIRPIDKNADIGDIYSSLSFAVGALTNILLDKNIPHNIFISEKGYCIYITPRIYEKDVHDDNMKCAWLEIAGVAICRNKKFYESITQEVFEKILQTEVSLSDKDFDELKSTIIKFFKTKYN